MQLLTDFSIAKLCCCHQSKGWRSGMLFLIVKKITDTHYIPFSGIWKNRAGCSIRIQYLILILSQVFPGGSEGKESVGNVGESTSIPGSGRSPGDVNGNPLQYHCLENSMDRGAWQAAVHMVSKGQTQPSGQKKKRNLRFALRFHSCRFISERNKTFFNMLISLERFITFILLLQPCTKVNYLRFCK